MNKVLGTMVLAAATALAVSGCAQQGGTGMRGPMTMGAASSGSQQMHQQMMGSMQQMQGMQMSGDTDKDFVRMMRMHHLQGIAMAEVELQKGDDAEARRMAQKIIDNQKKEVAEFDRWLQRNQ